VAEQVREALVRQRRRLSPGLSDLVAAALRAQAAVRLASGLGADHSWAAAVAARLEARLGGLRGRRVALLGCGRLNAAVAERLAADGAEALPFSHRAEIPWCAARGWRVLPWHRLREDARGAAAAVLGGRLTPMEAADLASALPPSAPILDLADANAALLPRCAAYEGLESFADGPPTRSETARLAAAERAAFAETLRWGAGAGVTLPPALRIGARRSALSMAQAAEMRSFLAALQPETAIEFVALDAPGDRDKTTPLPAVTADDFFTRDIDEAVRGGVVDAGLHSAKDLPRQLGGDLVVAAQTPSFAPWECLVTRDGGGLDTLPRGARIGTSSARRAQRLRELRPDLVPADIRGNVPDRVRQLDEGAYDGLILAATGLLRLRLEGRIAQVFSPQEFPPEPAQGALALVVRRDRADLIEALAPLDLGRARP
jgi:hydroxymethylbilane synthase